MKQNVGRIERVVRVALGGAPAVGALVLLLGGEGLTWLVIYLALIALAVDCVVTGIRGYCPLHNLLGTAAPGAPV